MYTLLRPSPLSDPDIAKMRFMMCEITDSYNISSYDDECLIVLRENLELYMKSVLSFMAKEKKMYMINCPTLTRKWEEDKKGKPPECVPEKSMPWQATINWGSFAEDEIATMKNNTALERETARNKRKMQSERKNSHKCKRGFNTSKKCRETNAENKDEGDKDNENNEGDSKKETPRYYINDLIVPKLMYKGPMNGTTAIFTLKDLKKLLEWNCSVIPRNSIHDIFMKRISMKMQSRTM